jgi:two-component sensor histidine kinase
MEHRLVGCGPKALPPLDRTRRGVNPPARKGFGTHIVGRLVREQSKGDMRLDWNPGGLGCEIVLALTSRSNPTGF